MSKDVEFQDVVYTVKLGTSFVSEAQYKKLLNGVSGVFKNGHLSAIMGPSGAGKSSLLNAVSGLRSAGVTGHIHTNKKTSCYLMQDDHHQPFLNLHELMTVACRLKLKPGTAHEPIISEILTKLNLNHRRSQYASDLSGGEKRRLSIALELVANPSIFFLDEPTSGLDEVNAAQCVRLLKSLASQGKTVVCTIHQPSAGTFALFDQVFVLARGQCVYQGAPGQLVPYLSYMRLDCPTHYSPCDYIIELCDTEDGDAVGRMAHATQNGKLMVCATGTAPVATMRTPPTTPTSAASCSADGDATSSGGGGDGTATPTTTILSMRNAVAQMQMERPKQRGGALLLGRMKAFSKFMQSDNHAVSGCQQFAVLLRLMMLKMCRNRTVLAIQLFHHVFCGLIFGLIFFRAADEGQRMFDHLKFCIGVVFFVAYTQVIVPVLAYPAEVKLLKKECFNRWYGLWPYYVAFTLSRLPFQIVFNVIFLSMTYWMSGLPVDAHRFALYLLVGLVVSFVAEGLGLAIGASFSITNGTTLGPLLIAPMLGLAIYGFDFANDISPLMYGLMKGSFMRVGVVALALTVFGYERPPMSCPDLYCHFGDPKVMLRFLRVERVSLWNELGFLVLFAVLFRTVFYLSLRRRVVC